MGRSLLAQRLRFKLRPSIPCLFPGWLAAALLAMAIYPMVARWRETRVVDRQLASLLDRIAAPRSEGDTPPGPRAAAMLDLPMSPALFVRVAELGPLLSSWQTVGGCGAGSATGAGAGVKWIGRSVSGGLFNVQTVGTYNRLTFKGKREQNTFVNTLVTYSLSDKWIMGANVPFVYKSFDNFFEDPQGAIPTVDVSNGGLGDVSVQVTRRLGRINATSLTALLGLPTGVYNAQYQGIPLVQHQQVGFGRVTGSLILDHTIDEIWGVVVVGGVASWRGGQNQLDSYRAPSATTYAYAGYFLGPFVPAVGLGLTGFSDHDRDRTQREFTGLLSLAPSVSVEWSTDWIALLAGAIFPYQYDGITTNAVGAPKSPWGWGSWIVGLGVALSPF
jgi:hypothetical protein